MAKQLRSHQREHGRSSDDRLQGDGRMDISLPLSTAYLPSGDAEGLPSRAHLNKWSLEFLVGRCNNENPQKSGPYREGLLPHARQLCKVDVTCW